MWRVRNLDAGQRQNVPSIRSHPAIGDQGLEDEFHVAGADVVSDRHRLIADSQGASDELDGGEDAVAEKRVSVEIVQVQLSPIVRRYSDRVYSSANCDARRRISPAVSGTWKGGGSSG